MVSRPLHFLYFLIFPLALAVGQESPFHGRVSYESGGLLVQGSEESEWSNISTNSIILPGDTLWTQEEESSEVEFYGGAFLALADASKVEVVELSPAPHVKAWIGSFYVYRPERSSGDFLLETPACQVRITGESFVRVDVEESGYTTVSAHTGAAGVTVEGGSETVLQAGTQVFVDVALLPSEAVQLDPASVDEFDQWARERRDLLWGIAAPAQTEVPAEVIGSRTLATQGEWVNVEGARCWRPTQVTGYVPYRNGYWSNTPQGYIWVEPYPFSYVTTHYGRWQHYSRYGWVWRYERQWRPAYAVTLRTGDYMVWAPLGFDNRPVIVNRSSTVRIGGIEFGLQSSSYVPLGHVMDGYGYISPLQPRVFNTINTRDVYVWNIGRNEQHLGLDYLKDYKSFQYDPPRRGRGPLAMLATGAAAPDVARALEQRVNRPEFRLKQERGAGATAVRGKDAGGRKVRLKAEARDPRGTATLQSRENVRPGGERSGPAVRGRGPGAEGGKDHAAGRPTPARTMPAPAPGDRKSAPRGEVRPGASQKGKEVRNGAAGREKAVAAPPGRSTNPPKATPAPSRQEKSAPGEKARPEKGRSAPAPRATSAPAKRTPEKGRSAPAPRAAPSPAPKANAAAGREKAAPAPKAAPGRDRNAAPSRSPAPKAAAGPKAERAPKSGGGAKSRATAGGGKHAPGKPGGQGGGRGAGSAPKADKGQGKGR